ncbi:MAG: glycosyltransferase family 9 protein [Lentisphaeria bacterium]|nr:glycosyltransferase family 9 protein [Lentisphaeria bacterium]
MQLKHRISLAGELFRYAFRPCRNAVPAKDGRKRVLVVRLDRIGDFALYLPFAAALRRRCPPETHHLTLLGNALWMPLARRMLDFDCFIETDPRRFLADCAFRRTLLDEISAMRCDLLLQPRFHRELLLEDLIAMAADAPEGLAFSGTTRHIRKRRLLHPWNRPYSRLADAGPLHDAHELVKNRCFLDIAAPGGGPVPNPWLDRPPLPSALNSLAGCVVILPGGGTPGLSWPSAGFGALAAQAAGRGLPVAVAATEAERDTAGEVIAAARIPAANLAGELDIGAFAALIANASLVIGNDTGGTHIAALSGVPSLVILGQGQPGIFHPYPQEDTGVPGILRPVSAAMPPVPCAGCYWECRYRNTPREYRCLRQLPVETVAAELEKLMAWPEARPS